MVTFQDRRPAPPAPEPPAALPFTVADVAGHEARHAAAALLMGMRVTEARADWPEAKTLGYVRFAGADVRDVMVCTLVGAMGDESMKTAWPPAWPLNPDSKIGDERDLAKHAADIVLTEHGYNRLCDDARRLSTDPTFLKLEGTLSTFMEHGVVLTEPMMLAMLERVEVGAKSTGLLHKSFEMTLDQTPDAGTFEATVAVFGNVDKVGDRVMPGAFTNTLAKWRASGDPIPVILSHQWENAMAHIGVVNPADAVETPKGLRLRGTLDVEDNEVARQVHKLMARRSLKEFSFGYSVPAGGSRKARDGANELLEIDLAEVGPTLKGMNPSTELHAVKSAVVTADPHRLSDDALRRKCNEIYMEHLTAGIEAPRRHSAAPSVDALNRKCRELGLPELTTSTTAAREQADALNTFYRSWFGR
jgi:HK97 family phage prohead protease